MFTCECYDRRFKCLELIQRTTDAELCAFLGKRNGISRYFVSDIYIPHSTSSMGKFMASKYVSIFLGNCRQNNVITEPRTALQLLGLVRLSKTAGGKNP